jgi:hypothetical protein
VTTRLGGAQARVPLKVGGGALFAIGGNEGSAPEIFYRILISESDV